MVKFVVSNAAIATAALLKLPERERERETESVSVCARERARVRDNSHIYVIDEITLADHLAQIPCFGNGFLPTHCSQG